MGGVPPMLSRSSQVSAWLTRAAPGTHSRTVLAP